MRALRGPLGLFGTALLVGLAACAGEPASDDFVPARDLSLEELAGGGPEIELVVVEPPQPPPSVYNAIESAVREGTLDRSDADGMLIALFFGDRTAVPESYGDAEASFIVPDVVISQIGDRLPTYPQAVQDALRARFAGRGAVARREPAWRRWLAAPVHAQDDGFSYLPEPITRAAGGVTVEVFYTDTGVAATANRVADLTAGVWSDIIAFFDSVSAAYAFQIRDSFRNRVEVFVDAEAPIESGGYFLGCAAGEGGTTPAYMDLDGDLHVRAGGAGGDPPCYLEGLVAHELFHKAHRQYANTYPGGWGYPPLWVTEGAAHWAIQKFAPPCNLEWNGYAPLIECKTAQGIDTLAYEASLFFTYLQQYGDEAKIKSILERFSRPSATSDLAEILALPEDWVNFTFAYTGYEAFTRDGYELAEFPYESTMGCLFPYELRMQVNAPERTLAPYSGFLMVVDVDPMAAQHQIVKVQADDNIEWIDVALTGALATDIDQRDDVQLTAVIVSDGNEEHRDWGDLWTGRQGQETPDLFDDDGQATDGSFRICLDRAGAGPCADPPEIFPGLSEVRIVLVNAGVNPSDRLEGNVLMLPGSLDGWEAEYFEFGHPLDTEPPE